MSRASHRKAGRPRTYSEERTNLTIRLTPTVRARIEKAAAKNRRSLSAEIEVMIEVSLATSIPTFHVGGSVSDVKRTMQQIGESMAKQLAAVPK